MLFRVLVVAEGLEPKFMERVDPLTGPIDVKLKQRESPKDARCTLRGRVVDQYGKPVAGASVAPIGRKDGDRHTFGALDGVDPLAITNLGGEFLIIMKEPGGEYDLEVKARGLATRLFECAAPGEEEHKLELINGVTVAGRVVKDGKPLSGVVVGLVQVDRSLVGQRSMFRRAGAANEDREAVSRGARPTQGFVGAYEIATDEKGEFLFRNVVPDEEVVVYGTMDSLKNLGALGTKKIQLGRNQTGNDAGDLRVEPAHRLAGRIILSDGKPVPLGTRVLLGREAAWDSQTVEADAEGRFVFDGLPTEVFTVSVRVRNYRLSSQNKSLDPFNSYYLRGLVDRDIEGLNILLEPGEFQPPNLASLSESERNDLIKVYQDLPQRRMHGVDEIPVPK